MNDERWVDCPGYEGLYKVSDQGRVFTCRGQRPLKGTVTREGYRQVTLSRRGERPRSLLVHTLVLAAFVGPRPPGFVCDHLSGNRLQNEVSNLEWVTPLENVLRAKRAGRLRTNPYRGQQHYAAKLTDEQVLTIRRKHKNGVSVRELAREYGVHRDTIYKILAGLRWKHLV